MVRTTLVLPEPLHQKLRLTAQSEGTSLTKLVRELLAQSLARHENGRLPAIYKGLKQLGGVGEQGIRDASTTIDALLYGQKGVWRRDE